MNLNDFSLKGKIAWITGASYGIGFAIAEAFAAAGAKICFNCRGEKHMEAALKAYAEKGIDAHGYYCDVTNEEEVKAMVAQIREEVGIIDILVASLRQRLADKSLSLELTHAAKGLIIERGYDPLYGARPLRRVLQSSVETLLARTILSGELREGSTITVDAENGELVCRY